MRFFMYDEQIVNLNHVTNFDCYQEHIPYKGEEQDFTLVAYLNYSHGYWEKEEMNMGAEIKLGKFKTKAEGIEVTRDILAGIYDVATLQPGTVGPEPTKQPTEQENEQQSEQTTEQSSEQTEDPKALEEAKEKAREVFKHEQTKNIATELSITTLTVYNTAQDIWGKSNTWDTKGWETYLIGLANFQQRKGVLYDKLKPANENETNGTQNGTAQAKNGNGPF